MGKSKGQEEKGEELIGTLSTRTEKIIHLNTSGTGRWGESLKTFEKG